MQADWESTITKTSLEDNYLRAQKSIRDIAKIYGCGTTTVKHYLLKYSIPIRTSCAGRKIFLKKDIPITTEFSEILDGLLLGDGNIQVPNSFQGIYSQAGSQKEFIDYVAEIFKKNNYYQASGEYLAYNKPAHKEYPVYYIHSMRTINLAEIFKRWYPDDKKHVPDDIKLTPNTVLFWYLGDGSKRNYCKSSYLHTCAFSLKEQELLAQKFSELGIVARIVKSGKYNIINISRGSNFDKFMKYMGNSPIYCYDYKFTPEFICNKEFSPK